MANAMNRTFGVPTPQSEPRPGGANVRNEAGGHSYALDPWGRLDRFLILGTDGGTFYATERALTLDNVAALDECLNLDGPRAVQRITEVSIQGLAPKNTQAIFALARATMSTDVETRRAAHSAVASVCRTGTHLFEFMGFIATLKGGKFRSGRGLRRGIARYYGQRQADSLALQAVKYRQRNGWTHADVLRQVHPGGATDAGRKAVLDFMTGKEFSGHEAPLLLNAYRAVNEPTCDERHAANLITAARLPWEAVPDRLRTPMVWEALAQDMPVGATVRQLPTFTRARLLVPLSSFERLVTSRLTDPVAVKQSRVHPLQVLDALIAYSAGGTAGRSRGATYTPNQNVLAALEETFMLAFENVEPAGKRTIIAVDASPSMTSDTCAGSTAITPRDGAAAMAMVTVRSEPFTHAVSFTSGGNHGRYGARSSSGLTPLEVNRGTTLVEAMRAVQRSDWGGTDCALPMVYAKAAELEVDTFMVFTDSETWAGNVHPDVALNDYRQASGIPARLVVVGMTSNGFTIGDPRDPGTLNVVGFSSDTPALMSAFSAGKF